MLVKFIAIKNIKQWQNKEATKPDFKMLNLIFGSNGSGKSTLSNIFECMVDHDWERLNRMIPYESPDQQPYIHIMAKHDTKDIHIKNSEKNDKIKFHIFNQSFIDRNIYTAKGVESSHLTEYYNFIFGEYSVSEQKQIDELKEKNEKKNEEIKTETALIEKEIGLSWALIKKEKKRDIEAENNILVLKKRKEDFLAISHFKQRSKLVNINLTIPLLHLDAFNIKAINSNIEDKKYVENHFLINCTKHDSKWIEDGLKLINEKKVCPFCEQDLSKSNLFYKYRNYFDKEYETIKASFKEHAQVLINQINELKRNLIICTDNIEKNKKLSIQWSDKISSSYDIKAYDVNELIVKIDNLENFVKSELKAKWANFFHNADLTSIELKYLDIKENLKFINNDIVTAFNNDIDSFLKTLENVNVSEIDQEIKKLESHIKIFDPKYSERIANLKSSEIEKKENEEKIKILRADIDRNQIEYIEKHKDSINRILSNFCTNIQISQLSKNNSGKGGSTRIQYVLKFIGKEMNAIKDSENIVNRVLSNGDKATLALAFFLSKFKEKNKGGEVIILDDPMSSLDLHRKEQTIEQIRLLVDQHFQVFVLSHDVSFLSEVFNYSNLNNYSQCFEIQSNLNNYDPFLDVTKSYRTSKIVPLDDYKKYVMHSYFREYQDIYNYACNPAEEHKDAVARRIRPLLESYMRFKYPVHFNEDGIWLGSMIDKLRRTTDTDSPLFLDADKLKQLEFINDFSKGYHHAVEADTKLQSLNYQVLGHYAQKTIQFVTGI